MTPQELKNSILQLAIAGKLVEQRAEEGTAEELFAQIQAEKQRLVAEGKLKKQKPLPEITEDEKPFDIPESWKWVRLGNLISIESGINLTKSQMKQGSIPVYGGNGITGYHDKALVYDNTIVIGRVGYYCGSVHITEKEAWVTDNAFIVDYPTNFIFQKFFVYMLRHMNLGKNNNATAQPVVSGKKIYPLLFPLPPLAEQKRIVAKIEQLLPYIDRYEKAWSRLQEFNKRFPADMQKSLLQYAIEGKLVEQRAEEGTAEELFAQIQTEKQRLVAEGKLKKQKPLPETTEDEKPFDIPESWKWVRLGEVFELQAGKNISASLIKEDNTQNKYLCYGGNGIRGYVDSYNRIGSFPIIGRQGALCGNINFATGYFYATEHAVTVSTFANTNVIWACHFLKALNLNQYATATAQPGLAVNKIISVLLPLPPLAEQKRIIARLEELLPLCDRLKK